ncbi:relaxase/mobilization nuclease domain-containing protein [Nitratireductor kimnyeongensis]|uniref:Relaxase/mobilization nuclease domain-containing protein n=1 Tax=Nitratireductor kimnyeongensis TaxID=430679 RepID=A0ABW0T373_9HYPH|nr:relaxase/mobilization nuclease domain-containing protein [Nitratireductor kimnyeongensis]QZZ35160.1 relaxase/mobilization nuclease domain-containing protein [Nitratireductor kimnyeongensis]
MILKAKERGDGPQLARYLLAMRDNDHVELHDVRGFASDDLLGAFHEADAIASGTRCRKHLFSMSLNPPAGENVSIEAFEQAISQIEEKLGLENQPRAVVFHEKDGRRHAHVVWSRIDPERMRALNMAHYKVKLRDVSQQLCREHGWDMPRGFEDRSLRDPLNFTRAEWQQARRAGLDPKQLKALFQKCWKQSASGAAFENALKERGFTLARGDRRGFVAVDYRGEIYSLTRLTGTKTKEVAARVGDPQKLPSADEARAAMAAQMTEQLQSFIKDAEREAERGLRVLIFRRSEMTGRHRHERQALKEAHEERWLTETKERAARLPRGFSGIWHRITGRYGRIRNQNEHEAWQATLRDRAERESLIVRQLDERRALQQEISGQREQQQADLLMLRQDITRYHDMAAPERERQDNKPEREGRSRSGRRRRTRSPRME